MGKRIEKAFGRDKAQSSATADSHDDDPNKTPEPHICNGHFASDFSELCRRGGMAVIPGVVLRPRRPPSPTLAPAPEEKAKPGKKVDPKNQPPPPEPEPEVLLDENGEPQEPPPKTYTTKEKFDYFKPTVQVEMDNPDKQDTVTEVYVRGWKIDDPMMNIFKQCWPKMDRLHTINLWYTGLCEDSVKLLSEILPDCLSLKNLSLDNNPVKAENWHLLIKEESPVQNLSLRYNSITDAGAELLGRALGTTAQQNTKLLSLNLNGNQITDRGAEHLAGGLRMNRTLLSLGLSHNHIEDKGANKLAEVLSRFPLTHEEVVERRKLLSTTPDRKSVSDVKGGKEEEKHDKTKGKKQDDKPTKKASVVAESNKGSTKKGHDKGKGKKGAQPQETEMIMSVESSDLTEVLNPLLDMIEPLKDGVLLLKGNMNLISLNLSYNRVGEEGVRALHMAVKYQTTFTELKGSKPGNTGLMRLCVQRNRVPSSHEEIVRLSDLMHTKDPFYKPPAKSPDQESTTH